MSAKWNLIIMLKSGKTYNILPFLNEGEAYEDAAVRMLNAINKSIEDGKAFHTLVSGGTNKLHSIIRVDSIEIAYASELKDTTETDKEAAEQKKISNKLTELHVRYYEELESHLSKRRPVDDILTQLQIEHYKILNQGDDWKKNDRGY